MSAAVSPEQSTPTDTRYGLALCGAQRTGRSSSGPGRCRNLAGWGTDHVGIGRCKLHLGGTRSHRVAAVRQEVTRRLATYGDPVEMEPHVALLMEVYRTAGHVAWLSQQISERADIREHDGQVLVQLYQRERDHLVRVAKTAIDAGVEEREVRLAEQQGRVIARAVLGVLNALDLTTVQYQTAKKLVSRKLVELGPGGHDP